MYIEILNPNLTCLLFSAVVWLYSRLLQLVKASPEENALLNAFLEEYHPMCTLFPVRPKAACLSRVPRLVPGVACSKGFPFCPAALLIPTTWEMRSCPRLPTSSTALLLLGQHGGVSACSSSPLLAQVFTDLFFFFKLKPSLCFLILILCEHWA